MFKLLLVSGKYLRLKAIFFCIGISFKEVINVPLITEDNESYILSSSASHTSMKCNIKKNKDGFFTY